MRYRNDAFISRLPDEEEKRQLLDLEIDIRIEGEIDEMWSYVGKKTRQRWLWYAIERKSRKVLAFVFGPRTDKTYRKLLALLPAKLLDHYNTDDWGAYDRVPFESLRIRGKMGNQRIERANLTLRTRIKRLARKTICFSKSEIMHDTVIAIFINEFFF